MGTHTLTEEKEHAARIKMFLTLLLCIGLCHAAPGGLDMDEKEFEEFYHLDPVEDEQEFQRRQDALAANEEKIRKVNEKYANGESRWFASLNDFANLPEDEFLKQKTGIHVEYGRGLLQQPHEKKVDMESEKYFDQFRVSRAAVPDYYNAVEEGIVSSVKQQGHCGACVAFASMSLIETCFKKITGVFGDYSEQQMIDCGYGNWANGCDGASAHAYLEWAGDNKIEFANETQYPYMDKMSTLRCPHDLPVFNQGARITGSYITWEGDEELMKNLVYEHGSVLTTLYFDPIAFYGGGIVNDCPSWSSTKLNHAVAVVGYGTEDGIDYWIMKNSHGQNWGERGYFRIQRGVGMCGIGSEIAATVCASA